MLLAYPDSCRSVGVRVNLCQNIRCHFLKQNALMAAIARFLAGEDADLSGAHDRGQRIRQNLAKVFDNVRETVQS